jgi:hypothetical protein
VIAHESIERRSSSIEQPACPVDGADQSIPLGSHGGGWPLDRPFPALMTGEQMAITWQIHIATYHRWKALGRFRRFLADPQLSTRHTRYCGLLVGEYMRGRKAGAQQRVAK